MGAMKMKATFIAIVISLICAFFITQSVYAQTDQDTGTNSTQPNLSSLRISLYRGFWLSGDEAQPGELTTIGVASIPGDSWWEPSLHAYLSYVDYQYSRGFSDRTITRVRAVSLSPSVKLFKVLFVGISYSNGKKQTTRYNQSLFRNEMTEEHLSRLSGIAGFEIDVHIYSQFYLSGGYALVSPYGFVVIGAALRFQ